MTIIKELIIEFAGEIVDLRDVEKKYDALMKKMYNPRAELRITGSNSMYCDTTQDAIMQQFSIIHALRVLLVRIDRHEIEPALFFEHLENLLTTKSEADLKHYVDLIEEKHPTPP